MAKGRENEGGGGGGPWGPVTPLFWNEKNLLFFQTKVPSFLDYKMYSILDKYVRQR
jgi:hypothetical protein